MNASLSRFLLWLMAELCLQMLSREFIACPTYKEKNHRISLKSFKVISDIVKSVYYAAIYIYFKREYKDLPEIVGNAYLLTTSGIRVMT